MSAYYLQVKNNQTRVSFSNYENIPYGVIVLDQINKAVYYNKYIEKLFNISRDLNSNFSILDIVINDLIKFKNQEPMDQFKISNNYGVFKCNTVPVFRNNKQYTIYFVKEIFCLFEGKFRECCIQKKIMESIFDGIYITDEEGKVIYFNDAFSRISGFKREECIGMKAHEIVERGLAKKNISGEIIRQKKPITMMNKYYNGTEAMVSGSPVFDEEGNLLGVVFNIRDMTELNQLNAELKKATALTASYRQQLKEAQKESARDIIYTSKVMKNIIDLASKVSNSDVPVLILGESGAGKDVIAKFIHDMSDRSQKGSLIQINCGAIPENLLESELFGYEKGAFTGAIDKGKVGLIELANEGTLFLDEIGDLPLNLQVKLLDVIQGKRIMRLGGTKHIPINSRLITATNKNLEKMIEEGKFRTDLYYRLNVVCIKLPPLRKRKEDTIPLVTHFLNFFNNKYSTNKSLSPRVIERFLDYNWPGNVRELINVMEKLIVTTEENVIEMEHLVGTVNLNDTANTEREATSVPYEGKTYNEFILEVEREFLITALKKHKTLKDTANALGMDVSTLVRKKKKCNIKKDFFP